MPEKDGKQVSPKSDKPNLAEILGVKDAKGVERARVIGSLAHELHNELAQRPYAAFAAVEALPDTFPKKALYAALAYGFAMAQDNYQRSVKEENAGNVSVVEQLETMRNYCAKKAGYQTPGTPTG